MMKYVESAILMILMSLFVRASIADEIPLKIGDGQNWSMPAGAWSEDGQGLIRVPDVESRVDEALAFYTPKAFCDVEIRCEFQHQSNHGDAGLILRAQDAQHYYVVHFPLCGQAYRTRNFWVAISKVDNASGWTRCLRLGVLPGINCELDTWHQVRATIKGDEICVWVDGRAFEPVRDATFTKPGRVGLMGFLKPAFRNVVVSGSPDDSAPVWNDEVKPGHNWFNIYPTDGWQRMPSLTRAPNSKLLMLIPVVNKAPVLVDSSDNGRSWQLLTELSPEFGWEGENAQGGVLHTTRDKKLILMQCNYKKKQLLLAESKDSGKTWSRPRQVKCEQFPSDCSHIYPYNPILETRDGALLWPGYGERLGDNSVEQIRAIERDTPVYLRYAATRFGFVLRSTDGGESWSVVSLHSPLGEGMYPAEGGCETNVEQLPSGELVAYIRPEIAATMWETRSKDDGRTWSSWTRSAVPGWATALVCTKSGALLLGHRMPGNAVNISYDGGLNWDQGTRVETSLWAQGIMMEVEPDVVFYAYMDNWETSLRGQLMRVTKHGLEPLPR